MNKDKKFALDKDTLEAQCEKLNEMIEGDKEAIAENNAMARDPHHVLDKQGEYAEARMKGNVEALSRHEQQLAGTKERLNKLKNDANQEYQGSDRAIEGGDP